MFISRKCRGMPFKSSVHPNVTQINREHGNPRHNGTIPKGTITGLYSAKFREKIPPKLVFSNRIIQERNYARRNVWKNEDAHHKIHKHTYSRRRQLFPIAEKNTQRYDFFPTSFVYLVNPEPIDHKRTSEKSWLPYKRDPTVQNKFPDNYAKFHISEDMTEFELIEYLKKIYELDVVNVELEKVDEINVSHYGIEKSTHQETLQKPNTWVEESESLGHSDRFKIAHCLLEKNFTYPNYEIDIVKDAEKFIELLNETIDDVLAVHKTEFLSKSQIKQIKALISDRDEFYTNILSEHSNEQSDHILRDSFNQLRKELMDQGPEHRSFLNSLDSLSKYSKFETYAIDVMHIAARFAANEGRVFESPLKKHIQANSHLYKPVTKSYGCYGSVKGSISSLRKKGHEDQEDRRELEERKSLGRNEYAKMLISKSYIGTIPKYATNEFKAFKNLNLLLNIIVFEHLDVKADDINYEEITRKTLLATELDENIGLQVKVKVTKDDDPNEYYIARMLDNYGKTGKIEFEDEVKNEDK